jgi:hypothetical protein
MMTKTRSILLALMMIGSSGTTGHSQELSTVLMNSTFEIGGPGKEAGKTSTGTVFLMGRPLKSDASRTAVVLITAAHVLDEISGDQATLVWRKKAEAGGYIKIPTAISIRDNGTDRYVKSPDADVAAMYIGVPPGMEPMLLSIAFLVNDARLEELEVHPGDELLCLGFPLA